MKILAIETSCDETAAAVVQNGRSVLSNAVASQISLHRLYGGVVPEMASRAHIETISPLCRSALEQARCRTEDLAAVAVTVGPGLIGALLTGVGFAKGFAYANGLPLVGVHHVKAHIAANYLHEPELEPPFLGMVVSGGHSHLLAVRGYTDFQVIGRTRDDAAGEAFDKIARVMGFPYPGGVELDRVAEKGNPAAFEFPRAAVEGSPYDFSFSGLKTAGVNLLHRFNQKGQPIPRADVAASFREAIADVLSARCVEAARDFGFRRVVLGGGVSANRRLRALLRQRCDQNGLALHLPPLELCGDNAMMVGAQGYYELQAGHTCGLDLNARASLPV